MLQEGARLLPRFGAIPVNFWVVEEGILFAAAGVAAGIDDGG
jgi:hypothetical protein